MTRLAAFTAALLIAGAASAESDHSTTASSNSILSAMAILGSVDRRNNSQDFRGGTATAVMGRCEIDLRAASIASSASTANNPWMGYRTLRECVDDLAATEARVVAAGLIPFAHGDYAPGRRFYFLDPDGI